MGRVVFPEANPWKGRERQRKEGASELFLDATAGFVVKEKNQLKNDEL